MKDGKKLEWREKFDKEFPMRLNMAGWEDFIVNEIIEQLIADIPGFYEYEGEPLSEFKKELKNKWL